MIIIPGWLIALVTFPGVIVHEAAHMLFCRWRNVAVFDVCFFRIGNPAGYVIHEPPRDFTSAFLISTGPFFINSLLCIVLCFPACVPVKIFDRMDPFSAVLMWLGVSIGMHAFPSNQDVMQLWNQAKEAAQRFNVLAIISFPLILLILLADLARFFWFDAIYGVAIGLGLPALVLKELF
jgi:hypothetical protein